MERLTDKQYIRMEKMGCAFIIVGCIFLCIILICAPIATEYNNILKIGSVSYQRHEITQGSKRDVSGITKKDYNIVKGFAIGAGLGILALFITYGVTYWATATNFDNIGPDAGRPRISDKKYELMLKRGELNDKSAVKRSRKSYLEFEIEELERIKPHQKTKDKLEKTEKKLQKFKQELEQIELFLKPFDDEIKAISEQINSM